MLGGGVFILRGWFFWIEKYADVQGRKGETQAKEGARRPGESLMPSGTSCRLRADGDNCDTCLRHVAKL